MEGVERTFKGPADTYTRSVRANLVEGGETVTVMSSLAESKLSLTVKRKTYVPDKENVAVVFSDVAAENVTVPGPLTLVQAYVSVAGGLGKPSSDAVPVKFAEVGNVIVWSAPALATGA